MYTWEITREKWVTLSSGLEFRLKYYFQLKTNERGCGKVSYKEVTRKSMVDTCKVCHEDASLYLSTDKSVSWFSHSSLPGTEREIALVKGSLLLCFQSFPCVCYFSKYSAQKKICQRGIFWGGIYHHPSVTMESNA